MTDDVVELTDEEAEAKFVAGNEDPSLEDEEAITEGGYDIGDHHFTDEQADAIRTAADAYLVKGGVDIPDDVGDDDDEPIDEAEYAEEDDEQEEA